MNYVKTLLLGCTLTSLACGHRTVIDGKPTAADGRTDAVCKVELHYEAGDPGTGLRCQEAGAPGRGPDDAVVTIGRQFECVTVAQGGAVDVTVACEGYQPYRSPAIRWSSFDFRPEARHLGDIVLTRATEPGPR